MGSFFFKHRGAFFVPVALLLFIAGKPTVLSFIIGLVFALLGEAIRIWGVGYAGITTRKDNVEAPFLVRGGPFSYVRNPLYIGNGITGLGFVIMACGEQNLIWRIVFIALWFLCYFGVYGMVIPHEEEFLKKEFGEPYLEYCKHVNRIFPNFKKYSNPQGTFNPEAIKEAESKTLVQFFIFLILMSLKIIPFGPLVGKLFLS